MANGGQLHMPFIAPSAVYRVERPPLVVHFADEVLAHFEKHKQDACWKREAGGQLFARISPERWEITRATGPRRGDYRRRFRFFPRRADEQAEINALFQNGLHYVGDWHTHPEAAPKPSPMDTRSMGDLVRQSKHELPGFLLVIVGTDDSPSGLWACLHSRGGADQQLKLRD
jgi:integrative and conjugative element protein (TIGR02256 family)